MVDFYLYFCIYFYYLPGCICSRDQVAEMWLSSVTVVVVMVVLVALCYACGSCLYRNILFLVWIAAHSSHHRKSFLLSSVLFGKVQVTGIIVKDIYAKFWAQFRFISDRLWAADECQVNYDRRGIVCRLTEIFKAVT